MRKNISLEKHRLYRGKIEIVPKCKVSSIDDFALWYTPGVAEPAKEIYRRKDLVYDYTNRWNTIAVISDGSRVLGLGNIGPEAALPVMEGKALIFKYLGGVDAIPLCVDANDPEELIALVKKLEPSFGGINLEDIARLLIFAGADPKKMLILDSQGTLHKGRMELKKTHPDKWEMCLKTNPQELKGNLAAVLPGADVLIALSQSGPGVIKKKWIKKMAKEAIVFACANPVPEIWPWEAKKAGARIVATGRSDFPNQVNNSLGFPGIFRGVLDVRAKTITDEMCIAAAEELSNYARRGLNEDKILPTMEEWEVYSRIAVAVGRQAMRQKIARLKISPEELKVKADYSIQRAQKMTRMLMKKGFIDA